MGLDEFGDCNHVAGRGAMCVYHPRRSAHALMAMKHTLLPGDETTRLVLDSNYHILLLSGTPLQERICKLDFNVERFSLPKARRWP